MTNSPESRPLDPLNYVTSRIRTSIDGRTDPIGIANVVGTHGTDVDSVFRLARDGYFSGGAAKVLKDRFYITPNVLCNDWRRTEFASDINYAACVNPIEVAQDYATSGPYSLFTDEHESHTDENIYGVVITFNSRLLDLVESVEMNDLDEPEAELRSAPPLTSIRSIYPVDRLAADALHQALASLREKS